MTDPDLIERRNHEREILKGFLDKLGLTPARRETFEFIGNHLIETHDLKGADVAAIVARILRGRR